jgi:hypothetical protein
VAQCLREGECGSEGGSGGVRVSAHFLYILELVMGCVGYWVGLDLPRWVELECPPRLMIYRGGCVRIPASVNAY